MYEAGGTVQNTLKGGGTEKRGGETNIKMGGNLGHEVSGSWNPLTNYDMFMNKGKLVTSSMLLLVFI